MPGVNLAGASQALDTSLPTVYSEFMILRDESGVMRSMATNMPLLANQGSVKNIINYGRLAAYAVADGVDIAQAQSLADFLTTATPSEVAVQCILGGRTMRRVADTDLQKRTGRIMNNAYDLKEDTDGITQLASFTGASTIGAAGTLCSPGHLAAAFGRLRIGDARVQGVAGGSPEPAPGQLFFLHHEYAMVALAGRIAAYAPTGAGATAYGVNTGAHAGVTMAPNDNAMAADIMRQGINALGTYAGGIIKYDANLLPDASDDATGAFFSKEGLIYVSEEEPRLDVDVSDKSMRGAVELNVWGSYAWTNYRPANYGIPATFDCSVPTS